MQFSLVYIAQPHTFIKAKVRIRPPHTSDQEKQLEYLKNIDCESFYNNIKWLEKLLFLLWFQGAVLEDWVSGGHC